MSEIIPPNWTPAERALAAQTERITAIPSVIRDVWSAQTCPAEMLPWLAWALHVDDWERARTEQQKRDAIDASIEIHRRKGTASAVRRALQALGYDVEIDEATGVPYTFRVVFDISAGGVSEDDFTAVEASALENKNARSHLLGVRALLLATEHAYVSAAPLSGEATAILPRVAAKVQAFGGSFIAMAAQAIDRIVFRPHVADQTMSGNFYLSGFVSVEMIYG